MITQHNVLLTEMLFLGSVLMIIILTHLAWEPVSQEVPLITQQQYISPRVSCPELLSLANLVPKLSQDVCLGKGFDGLLTTLRYSFYLFSTSSWEVYEAWLKLVRWVLSSPLLMSMSEAFSVSFTLNKIYTKLWVSKTVFGPRFKASPSETMNPVTPLSSS